MVVWLVSVNLTIDMEKNLKWKAPSTSNASDNPIDIKNLPSDPSDRPKMITITQTKETRLDGSTW